MKRLLLLTLLAALAVAASVKRPRPEEAGPPKRPERPAPHQALPKIKAAAKPSAVPRAVEDEQTEASRLADDGSLSYEARALALHEVLLRWARRDVAAASAWLLEAEADDTRYLWFHNLFKALAETHPRQALEEGLRLNAASDTDVVWMRTLLALSLKHLTAEDAIRVMNQPNRSKSCGSAPFDIHPQMDLKKLGDFIIEKAHLPPDDPRRPELLPSGVATVWMKRDMAGAYRFAMAMHDAGDGIGKGYELTQFASKYAETGPPEEAMRLLRQILMDDDIHTSPSDLALTFISRGERQMQLLLQAMEVVPATYRDELASYPLIQSILNRGLGGFEQRSRALRLFGTGQGRLQEVNRFKDSLHTPVERQEMQSHLLKLGHTAEEVAFLGF